MMASEQDIGQSEVSIKTWALPVSKYHPGRGLKSLDANNTRLFLAEYT